MHRRVNRQILKIWINEIPEGVEAPPIQIIGTEPMERMLLELKTCKYKKASLAVHKQNYAVKMYKNVGFEKVD